MNKITANGIQSAVTYLQTAINKRALLSNADKKEVLKYLHLVEMALILSIPVEVDDNE